MCHLTTRRTFLRNTALAGAGLLVLQHNLSAAGQLPNGKPLPDPIPPKIRLPVRKAELVGIPSKAVMFGNSHAVVTRGPQGESDMFYIPYFATSGSALVGCHAGTGKPVAFKLGSSGGYGCCVGSDGAIYVGGVGPGNLYRCDPATGKVENLGGAQFGAQYIWDAAATADGKVYGACYPTCSVLEYDIATKTLRDLGTVDAKEQYARAICVDHRGKVWVGVGTHAHLVVLDPKTGERHDVLPKEYLHNSHCYNLGVSGRYVLASLLYDGRLLVFDADTEKLIRVLPRPTDSEFWMTTQGGQDGTPYLYAIPNGDLYQYNLTSTTLTLLAPLLGQCERVVAGRYVHGINDQDYFLYDLQSRKDVTRRRLAQAGDGMGLFTLTGHRDGNIYGSTYINQHLFSFTPGTDTLTDLGKAVRVGGQVDSIHSGRDGRIYLGAYSMAHLAIYDPAQPWQPGRAETSNPRELGRIGAGQYRTRAIVLGPDGKIWVGSVPSYNSAPTGAFSCWDPQTGAHRSWTDLVPGGAVDHLVVDDRYVYAAGGGVLFVWDPQTEGKVYEEKRPVFALVAVAAGLVLGNSGADMFVLDATAMTVIRTFPSPIGQMNHMTLAPNGKIYGISKDALAEIDPVAWSGTQVAAEGGDFLAADRDSVLYFARGAELFRIGVTASN